MIPDINYWAVVVATLSTMVVGCLVMLAAANLAIYPLVLAGLFILASGITIAIVVIASLTRISSLRTGGGAVARQLGKGGAEWG